MINIVGGSGFIGTRLSTLLKHDEVEFKIVDKAISGALLVSWKDEPIFSMTIPGKLQSYLAAGIPVVAMFNGEGAELVRSSRAGLNLCRRRSCRVGRRRAKAF